MTHKCMFRKFSYALCKEAFQFVLYRPEICLLLAMKSQMPVVLLFQVQEWMSRKSFSISNTGIKKTDSRII